MYTEFRGKLEYINNGESFPLIMRVLKSSKRTKEGIIYWTSLNAVTKWLGKVNPKVGTFKFIEYEALYGEENIELPANYSCQIYGNSITGFFLDSTTNEKVATLDLKFTDTDQEPSPQLPPLEIPKLLKYNLVTSSNLGSPTIQDHLNTFRKLTQNSACWYKIADKNVQTQTKSSKPKTEEDQRPVRSCPNCAEPLVEKFDIEGKKIIVCANYPHCYGPYYY